jgi:hypothetical protein
MSRADDQFHDFVVAYADPVGRLAYLLIAGAPGTSDALADTLTVNAFARVRRHWGEVEASGAPESHVVEALLSALPHPHRAERSGSASMAGDGVARASSDGRASTATDGRLAVGIDLEMLRASLWSAWKTLTPQQRVPLVFVDISVASPRLAGVDVPESFASARRLDGLGEQAWHELKLTLVSDAATARQVDSISERELAHHLAETLREHSSAPTTPIDPYPAVAERVRKHRRRGTTAAVVSLLAVATLVVIQLSVANKRVAKTGTQTGGTSLQHRLSPANTPRTTGNTRVVDWPTRGNAATDSALIDNLRHDFVKLHPTAVGEIQVLLAADTPAFRVAYVTANSKFGVMQSWYDGPIGSNHLVEGSFSFGGRLVSSATVLTTALSNLAGRTELVVIGPPQTTEMELADFDFSKPPGPGFQPLPFADGIAIKDVSDLDVPSLELSLHADAYAVIRDHFDQQLLIGNPTTAERGKADPDLLSAALGEADDWRDAGLPGAPTGTTLLWGGSDSTGLRIVVLRLKTLHLSDLLIVDWNGDSQYTPDVVSPRGPAYRLAEDQPDFPLVFGYAGTRVGAVVPAGVASTALVVDGNEGPPAVVDANGFASMQVAGQYGLLGEQSLQVNLYDANGKVTRTLPVPGTA